MKSTVVPEKPTVANRLWEASMDAAVGCLYQPFTLALAGGCLPQHIFLRYTHQRLAVFRTGQRLLAKALSICKESEEEGQRVLGQALYGIEKDIAMLIEFQKDNGKSPPPLDKATRNYVNFLKEMTLQLQPGEENRDIAKILATVAPIVRLFLFLGASIQQVQHDLLQTTRRDFVNAGAAYYGSNNPYSHFIQQYSSAHHAQLTKDVEQLLCHFADLGDVDWWRLLPLYRQALELEYQFREAHNPLPATSIFSRPLETLASSLRGESGSKDKGGGAGGQSSKGGGNGAGQEHDAPFMVFSDFDETVSLEDTCGIVPEAVEQTLPQSKRSEWKKKKKEMFSNYSNSYKAEIAPLLEEGDNAPDFEGLLTAIDDFEHRMSKPIVPSNLLRGALRKRIWRIAGRQVVRRGCVAAIAGCMDRGVPLVLLSANWADDVVVSTLATNGIPSCTLPGDDKEAAALLRQWHSCRCSLQGHGHHIGRGVAVCSNKLNYRKVKKEDLSSSYAPIDGAEGDDLSTGEFETYRIISSQNKQTWLRTIVKEVGGGQNIPVVYIGDSNGDIRCLLDSDVGLALVHGNAEYKHFLQRSNRPVLPALVIGIEATCNALRTEKRESVATILNSSDRPLFYLNADHGWMEMNVLLHGTFEAQKWRYRGDAMYHSLVQPSSGTMLYPKLFETTIDDGSSIHFLGALPEHASLLSEEMEAQQGMAKHKVYTPPTLLSIGESDPCAATGLQSDLKTCSALGVYGTTVMADVVADARKEDSSWQVPIESFRSQLKAVSQCYRPMALKIGRLPSKIYSAAILEALDQMVEDTMIDRQKAERSKAQGSSSTKGSELKHGDTGSTDEGPCPSVRSYEGIRSSSLSSNAQVVLALHNNEREGKLTMEEAQFLAHCASMTSPEGYTKTWAGKGVWVETFEVNWGKDKDDKEDKEKQIGIKPREGRPWVVVDRVTRGAWSLKDSLQEYQGIVAPLRARADIMTYNAKEAYTLLQDMGQSGKAQKQGAWFSQQCSGVAAELRSLYYSSDLGDTEDGRGASAAAMQRKKKGGDSKYPEEVEEDKQRSPPAGETSDLLASERKEEPSKNTLPSHCIWEVLSQAALLLSHLTPWVLLKGGHLYHRVSDSAPTSLESVDVLASREVPCTFIIRGPYIESHNTLSTGNTLAAAIGANLAKGKGIVGAVVEAKRFLTEALHQSRHHRMGAASRGPLHHGFQTHTWSSVVPPPEEDSERGSPLLTPTGLPLPLQHSPYRRWVMAQYFRLTAASSPDSVPSGVELTAAAIGGATAIIIDVTGKPERIMLDEVRGVLSTVRRFESAAAFDQSDAKHSSLYGGRVPVLVKGPVSVAIAAEADGVLLTPDSLPVMNAREIMGSRYIIAVEVETYRDIPMAVAGQADVLMKSIDVSNADLSMLQQSVAAAAPTPLILMAPSLSPDDIPSLLRTTGAGGLATVIPSGSQTIKNDIEALAGALHPIAQHLEAQRLEGWEPAVTIGRKFLPKLAEIRRRREKEGSPRGDPEERQKKEGKDRKENKEGKEEEEMGFHRQETRKKRWSSAAYGDDVDEELQLYAPTGLTLPPPPFMVPDFATRCLQTAGVLYGNTFRHPLLRYLESGELSKGLFRRFVLQARAVLLAQSDVLAVMASQLPVTRDKRSLLHASQLLLDIHEGQYLLLEDVADPSGPDHEDTIMKGANYCTRAYRDHLYCAGHRGSVLEGVMAVAAGLWLYVDIGRYIEGIVEVSQSKKGGHLGGPGGSLPTTHPFRDWIYLFSGSSFHSYTSELLQVAQALTETTNDRQQAAAVNAFVASIKFERMMLDDAWRAQQPHHSLASDV